MVANWQLVQGVPHPKSASHDTDEVVTENGWMDVDSLKTHLGTFCCMSSLFTFYSATCSKEKGKTNKKKKYKMDI